MYRVVFACLLTALISCSWGCQSDESAQLAADLEKTQLELKQVQTAKDELEKELEYVRQKAPNALT